MPDLPRALAATWVVPSPTPVTTPAGETLATAAFSTVHVTEASGTSSPAAFRTSAWSGSCALSEMVGAEGFTTMSATDGVASGCVLLPHDQLATAAIAARVRRIPNND